jgi:hypothetical protein
MPIGIEEECDLLNQEMYIKKETKEVEVVATKSIIETEAQEITKIGVDHHLLEGIKIVVIGDEIIQEIINRERTVEPRVE